jgi:hypothetical protein
MIVFSRRGIRDEVDVFVTADRFARYVVGSR